jgi:hypothetical protein
MEDRENSEGPVERVSDRRPSAIQKDLQNQILELRRTAQLPIDGLLRAPRLPFGRPRSRWPVERARNLRRLRGAVLRLSVGVWEV